MFDYKSVVLDEEIGMTFYKSEDDPNKINAFKGNENIGYITINGATFEASDDEVFMAYKLWRTRPERKVGQKIDLVDKNIEQLIDEYEELFIGAYILTNDTKIVKDNAKPYEGALGWLRSTDFYVAPASTRFHDAVPSGLLVHTLKVYNNMVDLIAVPAFSKVNVAQATFAALVHDWCKIGMYESYMRNVKDEATGQWKKEPAYRVEAKNIPLGHGVTSMYLASRVSKLSVEQCLAIRHHMGPWNVADVEKPELQKANETYPLVYLIQFADQLACTSYSV